LRVGLTGAVAALVCGWSDVAAPAAVLSAAGLLCLGGEILVGLTLGFVLQLSFAAPTLAAEVIGGAMGMSLSTSVDPNSGAQSPALGQYYGVVLTLVFFALGGHLQWIALVVDSYRTFPPGETWLGPERFEMIAGFATQMFATGVVIALPVTLVLLLVQLIAGVLSRSAPALNLFALGLPAGVLAGLAALIVSAPLAVDRMTELSADAVSQASQAVTR
jgi:flagellar biosynthetic protein FliR